MVQQASVSHSSKSGSRSSPYYQGLILALAILLLGLLMELITSGQGVRIPSAPYSIYAGFVFLLFLILIHIFYRHHPFVRWLSGVPSAICSIGLFALLVLMLGFIPQGKSSSKFFVLTGLNHLKTSWPFMLSLFYLLTSLGLVILRRLKPFTVRNAGFFLNHAGLWLVLVAGGLGSSDLMRLQLELFEGNPATNVAYDNANIYCLPFSLQLKEFVLEEYPPRIAFADARTFRIISDRHKAFFLAEPGTKFSFKGFAIQVDTLLTKALPDNGIPENQAFGRGIPACHVTVFIGLSDTIKGWIACGNRQLHPMILRLDSTTVVALLDPEPRKFQSLLNIVVDNDTIPALLEVNKPLKIKGWKLYQMGYDQAMGKDSRLSIIEAVSDPWLPVVYAGIFMLLVGAVYLFWFGRVQTKNNSKGNGLD